MEPQLRVEVSIFIRFAKLTRRSVFFLNWGGILCLQENSHQASRFWPVYVVISYNWKRINICSYLWRQSYRNTNTNSKMLFYLYDAQKKISRHIPISNMYSPITEFNQKSTTQITTIKSRYNGHLDDHNLMSSIK